MLESELAAAGLDHEPIDRDDLYSKYEASPPEWMQIEHDGAQLVEIPGCGHAPLLMSPMEIDVIARFIGADAAVHAAEADALQTA